MPIDPRELRHAGQGLAEVVLTDRPCRRCDYNLRGLPTNGNCPECGLPIGGRGSRTKRLNNSLSDAPMSYLQNLRLGLILMAIFSVASVAAFFVFSSGSPLYRAAAVGFASLGWWLGVYLVTAPRPMDENTAGDWMLDSKRLRSVNRGLQLCWAAAAVGLFATARMPSAAWLVLLLFFVGLVGLVPLSIQLSGLADWARHTDLASRFRVAVWMLCVCGIVLLAALPTGAIKLLSGFLLLAISATILCIVLAQLLFLVSLFQLAATVNWAIANAQFATDRALRLAERTARGEEPERPCPNCDYDLRGLPPTARCPECGYLDPYVKYSGIGSIAGVDRAPADPKMESEVPLEPGSFTGPSKVKLRESAIRPQQKPRDDQTPPPSPNIPV